MLKTKQPFNQYGTVSEQLYDKTPFALELHDKKLTRIGIEIHTDSIRYIYDFNTSESYLIDTLHKYQFDVDQMNGMSSAICKSKLYLDHQPVNIMKNVKKISRFHLGERSKTKRLSKARKIFHAGFFDQPQPYDEQGRLLGSEDLKKPVDQWRSVP